MEKDSRIYIAGHNGLVGSALVRRLKSAGYSNILTKSHCELDLTKQTEVDEYFSVFRPEYVFLAAAKVGGILANSKFPAAFLYQNVLISFNIIEAARKTGVKKLINLGSSCIYPKLAPQPLKEEYLLTGPLEPTNEAYAIAKIAGIKLCSSFNQQYGTDFLSLMPTNLYGPGDHYSLEDSHVLPALIRKFHEAKVTGRTHVVLWGDGSPLREFLFSDDLADAAVFIMDCYGAADIGDLLNVGTGEDLSISELAGIVKSIVFGSENRQACEIIWDVSKPNGTPRKVLDCSRLRMLGWKSTTPFLEGLKVTYDDFLKQTN